MAQYFIRNRGEVRGPFPPERLKEMARRGQFGRHYQVSDDGEVWESAADRTDLLPEARPVKVRKQPPAEPAPEPAGEPAGYELTEEPTPGDGYGDGGDLRLAEAASSVADQAWYYARAGQEYGPVSFEQLRQLAAQGQLQFNDAVWAEGMATWIEAFSVSGLFPAAGSAEQLPQRGRAPHEILDTARDPTAAEGPIAPFAMASLVSGLIGLPLCLPSSIVAVVLGHLALRQIAAAQGELGGRGVALAGLILGYASGAITSLVLLAWVVGPP